MPAPLAPPTARPAVPPSTAQRTAANPGELFVFLDSGDIAHLTARAESKGKRFSDVGLFLNGVFLNGASPRRDSARSKAAGFSRMKRMSCMAWAL